MYVIGEYRRLLIKRTISILVAIVMLCLLMFTGCQQTPGTEATEAQWEDLNWELNCARMTLDGQLIEKDIPCTFQMMQKVQGSSGENSAYVNGVITPEEFPYSLNILDYHTTYTINPLTDAHAQTIACVDIITCGDYWTYGIGWRRGVRGIHIEKGYMITYMPEINECLVGSLDPNVDPAEIFAFFEEFRNSEIVWSECGLRDEWQQKFGNQK